MAKLGGRASATVASIPSPIGGWNARDSISEMKSTDAVYLTNWYPTVSDVRIRKGYSNWATGLPGQVETLMNYSGGATSELFAVSVNGATNSIYDVTAGGAVGAPVVTTLTNARFQYTNITTAGGSYMMAVNGDDKLRGYNGSAWWIDGDGTHDITGVDTATCIGINLAKSRIWLVQKDTLKVWYLPSSSIAGVAQALDFSSVARLGGYIMAMENWTIDAGNGVDDHCVFITSNGEVLVYAGSDPSSITTWSLVGIWQIGSPVGRRCSLKWAGDCLLMTQDGLTPMAAGLQSSRLDPRVNLTDKIFAAISQAASDYGTTFGWQILYYARENMLILNIPVAVGQQQQYVMNTITKSWCNWTGWNANCWVIWNEEPYYGGNGVVCKAWDTDADNGTNINADAKQAFSYFGSRGKLKRWTMVRPILLSSGQPAILSGLNIDFDDTDLLGTLSFTGISYGLWDSTLWDTGFWGGNLGVNKSWQGVNGVGFAAALRLKSATAGIETHWTSTDFVLENGGVL